MFEKITTSAKNLTLPVPSLLVPTPDTKGGGGGSTGPPAISETLGPMNLKFCRILKTSLDVLRRISCHGRNHSQAGCEYSFTIFLCCQHHREHSLLGSKFSTNLLFAASKCRVTIQRPGS